ncbi:MAG: DUF6288 domain-containing protein, partial [Phycisphaeraceae bacterium]|nr:DUF6288 domain-containing protein [Phycisphaeraceae bacterium]
MKMTPFRLTAATGAFLLAVAMTFSLPTPVAAETPYYSEGGMHMFNPYPNNVGRGGNRAWNIRYFGPVGIGIQLKRPGMTMHIRNVEEGSPAAATGKLRKGQIIESINGVVLKEKDPRIILGDIITEAEATDGIIDLQIRGEGNVQVQIPVMGSYSDTWPLNCEKSDKIVRNLADLIAKQDEPSWGSVIFLLSTGEEKDLDVVRKWMKDIETIGHLNWQKGYSGPGLCEYYLRTGDESVLPVIKKMTEELKQHMYNGGWSGRGAPASFTYSTGNGQLHAAGVHCMTFLLLARMCGVDVDDYMFDEALKQFYRFSGHGNVAYGNGPPEGGYRDNGKTSGLAIAMAVAARLTPDGKNSVYADARDNSAMKAFYATNWFHAAHTGGGMGEIWHHGAMSLMREKWPTAYRSYFDTRRWVMELSRRHDGSIAIAGMDDRYNRSLTDASSGRDWGTFFAYTTYTAPRKHLQMFGAPRSPHAKHFDLPDRPWGTPADDKFQSFDPIPGGTLTKADIQNETVETNASVPMLKLMDDPDVSDETLLKYLHHPEYGVRTVTIRAVIRHERDHLILPLLRADDPRLREIGLLTLTGFFKGRPLPDDRVTPAMLDEVGKMIEDPNESWWVTRAAVQALRRGGADRIARHRDRLLDLLEVDSVWLQDQVVLTLAEIATDPAHYRTVLKPIIDKAASFTVDHASRNSLRAIQRAMRRATPEVKAFVDPLVKERYTGLPSQLVEPHPGAVMNRGATTVRNR